MAGAIITADGLLPTKSFGPNPMWPEVLIGISLLLMGIISRRMVLGSLKRDESVEQGRSG